MDPENALTADAKSQIDFNLHMVPAALGLDVPDVATAAILNVSEVALVGYIAEIETTVRHTAQRLLEKHGLATALEKWPVPMGGTILAVGDSITTYRFGYARILAATLAVHRVDDAIRFANVGQSGYTSTHGLETTFTQNLDMNPDWVFIKFGVNDCKRFGGRAARTLVSLDEYRANMAGIVDAYQRFTDARIILLTPTPVVEQLANSLPDFVAMRMTWDNTDLAACAEFVRDLARLRNQLVVDLFAIFGPDPDPDYFLPDGLHPNRAGHEIIAERVLETVRDI
ncbi:MAG: GDSL-type esterase/lipase family protein [Chloroflexota bacterium]|nr:GDSL-type esterase/lipase family protein [Chloroflexota bacterium]